jgi:Short C-terminal domain
MPGLLRGVARTAVIAGTATSVSNRVSRRQAGRWAQQDAQQQYQEPPPQYQQPPPPPAASGGSGDMIEQLKQLAELKDQGVLTEAEFAVQKSRILGA